MQLAEGKVELDAIPGPQSTKAPAKAAAKKAAPAN
jgi:hypothetical protein